MTTQHRSPVDRGPFGRALANAIRRNSKLPLPLALTLCSGDGETPCALPVGHFERAGTEHVPAPWRKTR